MPNGKVMKKKKISYPKTAEFDKMKRELAKIEAIKEGKREMAEIGVKRKMLKEQIKQARKGRSSVNAKRFFHNLGVIGKNVGTITKNIGVVGQRVGQNCNCNIRGWLYAGVGVQRQVPVVTQRARAIVGSQKPVTPTQIRTVRKEKFKKVRAKRGLPPIQQPVQQTPVQQRPGFSIDKFIGSLPA